MIAKYRCKSCKKEFEGPPGPVTCPHCGAEYVFHITKSSEDILDEITEKHAKVLSQLAGD